MIDCVRELSDSYIKVEEKGKMVLFSNKIRERYIVGRVDGCLIVFGERADYFVSNETHFVIVELKGSDVKKAAEQIFSTATNSTISGYADRRKLQFLVVCSAVPPASRTAIQLAKSRAISKYRASLKVVESNRTLDIRGLLEVKP